MNRAFAFPALMLAAAAVGAFRPTIAQAGATVFPAPHGAPVSDRWSVTVGGRKMDIYGVKGQNVNFAVCEISGKVKLVARPGFGAAKVTVHPLSKGLQASKAEDGWSFDVDKPCSLTLVADGNYMKEPLHLFFNPPAVQPPAGAIVFGPGRHVPPGPISLKSGQTLYLAGGAWVEAHVVAQKAQDIRITGSGVLNPKGNNQHGIHLIGCKNVQLDGIVELKAARGWCTLLTVCEGVTARNYRVIGIEAATTDGFNPCSSKNVTAEDCFIRAHDDCVAIKGIIGSRAAPAKLPPVENIAFRRCQFWSTYNNVICIGAETRAKHIRNVRVEDCDVLYHKKYWRDFGTFSILPLHGTFIEDLAFENIRVEYTENKLFCFKFGEELYGKGIPGDHSFPGGIRNVRIKNVSVLRQVGGPRSEFSGLDANKRVEDVKIENLRYGDKIVGSQKEMGLQCNAHVSGVTFQAAEPGKKGP